MARDDLLALTEGVYDAAAGGTPWTAVERALKAATGARTAVLMVGDVATGGVEMLWREGFADDAVVAYQRHYRHVDLWTTRAAALLARGGDMRGVLTNGTLVPDAELLRSEFYNDFGRPLGLRWVAGTVAPLGEAGAMPICLHRPDDARPFEPEARRLLDGLLPHLRRAMQLRHRLRAADAATGLAALDALPSPVLVLDAEARVVLVNAAAEALAESPEAVFRLSLARVPAGLVAGRRVFMVPVQGEAARGFSAL
ncbi:MAG: PAS domain-containing protein, partial [Acetobacteraceae bacterium]|nr:PAS domain-containing protein [Acetobacteraceae bacterium]